MLSSIEMQLLVLAGLSEEHEGLASILRTLHPRGEPRATVGLAAQLLCDDQLDRRAFRELIETSAVMRSGALRVTGDGPFFEHSLQPAEVLWSALHGIDVWPVAVIRLNGPIAGAGLDVVTLLTSVSSASTAAQARAMVSQDAILHNSIRPTLGLCD